MIRENALIRAEALHEIQKRGRFFAEMFPGTKASDEWQRHRERLQQTEPTLGTTQVRWASRYNPAHDDHP
jgi:hypothetical protein